MALDDPLDDNPVDLNERDEIADEIRSRGHDPMDIRSDQELVFGWSLLHSGSPGDRLGGRSEETMALEAERVIDAARERDIGLSDPVDLDRRRVPDMFEDGDLII